MIDLVNEELQDKRLFPGLQPATRGKQRPQLTLPLEGDNPAIRL